MWSVVEKTALAEAEVEYEDYTSDTVWVKFPVEAMRGAQGEVSLRLGNPADAAAMSRVLERASRRHLDDHAVDAARQPRDQLLAEDRLRPLSKSPMRRPDNWAKPGDMFILADKLADRGVQAGARHRASTRLHGCCRSTCLPTLVCAHPLASHDGYDFDVPLLAGDHVTDDAGTGFVHTAPGHGREDFDVWTANARALEARGINTAIPYTVDENGAFTEQAPGFTGKRVITDKGEKGDANEAVIKALIEAGMIIARGRLKHQYPHSWRSKKPVIFRNTPQWFIAMDKPIAGRLLHLSHWERSERAAGEGLRLDRPAPSPDAFGVDPPQRGEVGRARRDAAQIALREIKATRWVPAAGENRITGMIESRPDWVISRQRAWGVPIAVFVREKGDGSAEILDDEAVNERIAEAFEQEGADAWYAGRRARALPRLAAPTRTGRRSTTSATSGSIPARPTPSCWRTRCISRPRRHPAQARRRRRTR